MSTATRRYCDPTQLAASIRDYRDSGQVSDALGHMLLAIAGGIWDRYHFGLDRDDFIGSCVLRLIRTPLAKCDPDHNPFAFLSTCAIRFGLQYRQAENRREQCDATYRAALVEAMYPGPVVRAALLRSRVFRHESACPDDY